MAKAIPRFAYTGVYSTLADDNYWYIILKSSGDFSFSCDKTVDAVLIGGGGSGADGNNWELRGGGSGYNVQPTGFALSRNNVYTVTIGKGASAGSNQNGEETTAFGYSASGGVCGRNGGYGAARGGNTNSAGADGFLLFNSEALGWVCGSGAGGNNIDGSSVRYAGGRGGGGNGGYGGFSGLDGSENTGAGGGSGGYNPGNGAYGMGGAGGSGIVVIRGTEDDYIVSTFSVSSERIEAGTSVELSISNEMLSVLSHEATVQLGTSYTMTQTLDIGVDTAEFSVPLSWIDAITTSESATATILLTTLLDGTSVGTTLKSITIVVPESIVPVAGGITLTRVDNSVPAEWNEYVQGLSGVTVEATGFTGVYGSTIASYTYEVGKTQYFSTSPSLAVTAIMERGEIVIRVTATDSRSRVATAETTITVLAYSPPAFTSASVDRVDSSGEIYDLGTYAFLTGVVSYSPCNGKNSCSPSVYYRKSGETSWTYAGVFDPTSGMLFGGGQLDTDYDYEILLRATDSLSSVDRTIILDSVSFTLHFKRGGKGVAFGKPSSIDNAVEITEGWSLLVGGEDVFDKIANAQKSLYFSIPVSSWTGSDSYETVLVCPTVTESSSVISVIFANDSHRYCKAPIAWKTEEGQITLTTQIVPTGELEGQMIIGETA